MKEALAIVIVVSLGYALFETAILGTRIMTGRKLSENSASFQYSASPERFRILIIGDSTGVGTGADGPQDSVAGRISRDFPGTTIENRAEDGAKFANVISQLNEESEDNFDLILIQAGGNDILRFTPLDMIRVNVEALLKAAKERARRVVLMSSGNVGNAPAFFPPVNWLYTSRTRKVRELLMNLAQAEGVVYVDLFMERRDDPFIREPERYNAADFLHPGSEGYRLWYEALKAQARLDELIDKAPVE
jgi:lysophospholipase L1-like esterase